MKCFNCKGELSIQEDGKKITLELKQYSPADVAKFLAKIYKLPGALSPTSAICYQCFMKEVIGKEIK